MERFEYEDFIAAKSKRHIASGFSVPDAEINQTLFDWQREVTRWAIRKGRAAIFAGCGLGKTAMQLEWANQVCGSTKGNALLLAPLAVAEQTHGEESPKFHIRTTLCRSQSDCRPGINIANYEMLQHFDPSWFTGVVIDESSILKSFDGATKQAIIDSFNETPYRLACTATPAPNDYMELGNHAEFLGVMTRTEMLAMFFVHDGGDTGQWRLKGHAETEFWKWVCSWAVVVRKPSDLGYSDTGYELPPMRRHQITIPADFPIGLESMDMGAQGLLIPMEASTLQERRGARRDSIDARVAACAELVNGDSDSWLVWCGLNDESTAIANAIPGAIEVTGADSREFKVKAVHWFTGKLCVCNERLFRDKLATWQRGNQNISGTGKPKLQPIRTTLSESVATKRAEPRKKTKSTCGSIMLPTKNVGQERQVSSGTAITPREESNIGLIQNSANVLNPTPENTASFSLSAAELMREELTTALLATITAESSYPKMAGARFAGEKILATPDTPGIPYTLTTAMKQEQFEVSSARDAISDLESSKIAQIDSNEQRCTCGYLSGRRVLVSKIAIYGLGINLQNCHKWVHVGISDSFEAMYQGDRRCWRFGQDSPCDCYVVTSELEGAVVRNIERKERDFETMNAGMVEHMRDEMNREVHGSNQTIHKFENETKKGEGWTAILGDSVEELRSIETDSIHYSIFSPPFASLYTYSASERDLGNCGNDEDFMKHFGFIVKELSRIIMAGRLVSFHCMLMPTSIGKDGFIGLNDFRGDLIRLFQSHGFIFHSEVVIWKDPLVAASRTHALGLAHKQIVKDSAMCRQGVPDYLITMRKPGENEQPVKHGHRGFERYIGEDHEPKVSKGRNARENKYSHLVWQRYASPVWMDINPSDTLQRESAREEKDERHICPLQLQVIERAIELWTNPGDTVLSPFMGIGSEGHVAIQAGRGFVGIELKRSYFDQAWKNLTAAEKCQSPLFAEQGA